MSDSLRVRDVTKEALGSFNFYDFLAKHSCIKQVLSIECLCDIVWCVCVDLVSAHTVYVLLSRVHRLCQPS